MPDRTEIAVLGAGPAGANAALAAVSHGFDVTLLDEQPEPGGQVWRAKSAAILEAPFTPETHAGNALHRRVRDSDITHLGNTRIWQIERECNDWVLHILRDKRCEELRSKALVLATGARDFVQPVPGWTTPGVLGLAGATALFKQELVLPGERTIVSGTGPLAFFVASEIRRLGGEVSAVITPNSRHDIIRALPAMLLRPDLMARGTRWIADLMLNGVPIHWRHAVTKVHDGSSVTGVEFRRLDPRWFPKGPVRRVAGDSVCLGNGLTPDTEAAQLAGLPLVHAPGLGGWIPAHGESGRTELPGLFVCGDGAGIRGSTAAEIHGTLAGLSAAAHLGADVGTERNGHRRAYSRAARFGVAMTRLSVPRPGLAALASDDTIICRCESLRQMDIAVAIVDGAGSLNAVKSASRAGMGPCGGKYCQTAVARIIAVTAGLNDGDVPPPTPRPPLRPVPITALAGEIDYHSLPIPSPAPL